MDEHWANLIHSAITRGCLYRPKPPYADWLSGVLSGKVAGQVEPTDREMAALEKVGAAGGSYA